MDTRTGGQSQHPVKHTLRVQWHMHLAEWPSAVWRRDEITARTRRLVEREQEGR